MPDEYPYCEFCGAGEDDCRCDNGGCLAGLVDGCLSLVVGALGLLATLAMLVWAWVR